MGTPRSLKRRASLPALDSASAVWVLGGLGEALLARGMVLISLELFLAAAGPEPPAAGIAVCAAAFGAGVMHAHQGLRAVVIITQPSVLFGVLFVVSGDNLWAVILCHGLYDPIAFVRFATKHSTYSKLDTDEGIVQQERPGERRVSSRCFQPAARAEEFLPLFAQKHTRERSLCMHEYTPPRRDSAPSLRAWLRRPAIMAPLGLLVLLLGVGVGVLVGFAHRSPHPASGPACPEPRQTVPWPSPDAGGALRSHQHASSGDVAGVSDPGSGPAHVLAIEVPLKVYPGVDAGDAGWLYGCVRHAVCVALHGAARRSRPA